MLLYLSIKRIFICLSILLAQSLNGIEPLTPGQAQELSQLLNMPSDTDPELYNKLIQEEVVPILKEQFKKHHSDMIEPEYIPAFAKEWVYGYTKSNGMFFVSIPIDFIAHVIRSRLNNTPSNKNLFFWGGIAAFHHEITHIKNQHSSKKLAAYGIERATHKAFFDSRKNFIDYFMNLEGFLALCREHEWEADEGVPNHRLMLQGIRQYFQERATMKNSYQEDSTHPPDKDRAERFAQRLEILLKQRTDIVSRTFGLDKLPKIPAPDNMLPAAKLLNLQSEHYESILDFIGEHKTVV